MTVEVLVKDMPALGTMLLLERLRVSWIFPNENQGYIRSRRSVGRGKLPIPNPPQNAVFETWEIFLQLSRGRALHHSACGNFEGSVYSKFSAVDRSMPPNQGKPTLLLQLASTAGQNFDNLRTGKIF